eukprot:4168774-Amphidinium_carterae.1
MIQLHQCANYRFSATLPVQHVNTAPIGAGWCCSLCYWTARSTWKVCCVSSHRQAAALRLSQHDLLWRSSN